MCKFDFDKAVFLPIDPCMVWAHFKMPVTRHPTPQPSKGMEWYTKGVPFLSNMVCGKVRTWTSAGAGLPRIKLSWVPPEDKMLVTSHSTPQPPKGMEWYTKGVPFLSNMVCGKVRTWTSGQGFPVKICWVPPGAKMPPTSNSNPQPLEMNGMVYERSTFSANC